jgi:hypothetical protein
MKGQAMPRLNLNLPHSVIAKLDYISRFYEQSQQASWSREDIVRNILNKAFENDFKKEIEVGIQEEKESFELD